MTTKKQQQINKIDVLQTIEKEDIKEGNYVLCQEFSDKPLLVVGIDREKGFIFLQGIIIHTYSGFSQIKKLK